MRSLKIHTCIITVLYYKLEEMKDLVLHNLILRKKKGEKMSVRFNMQLNNNNNNNNHNNDKNEKKN